MKFDLLHPRNQIVDIINRIYQNGMTTTSGGNLSIRDDDGSIWITPGSVDKGSLTAKDIVRITKDGKVEGIHKPSSELPFHQTIYNKRNDIKAIIHAHPPALVSFAITRKTPDTRIIPKASEICGKVGYAKYALPGSDDLGNVIAEIFAKEHDTVLMENHGVVVAGNSLMHAFHRLETLDFCARLTLKGSIIGKINVLNDEELKLSHRESSLDSFNSHIATSEEKEIRSRMISLIHRSYDQKLFTSLEGTFSARVDRTSFLITPWGMDRKYLSEEDLVFIKDNKKEEGKTPSKSIKLHLRIYEKNPNINAIIIAHPPNILAFCVSDVYFDTRTIPESYLVLKEIPKLPYGLEYGRSENNIKLEDIISDRVPIVLCQNNCIIVSGQSLLQSYDRLEVAEFSAKSIIASKVLGNIVSIGEPEIAELEKAFDM